MKRIGLLCMLWTSMMAAETITVHNGSDKEVSIVVVYGSFDNAGRFFVDGGNTKLDYPAGIQTGHVKVLTLPAHADGKIGRPKKVAGSKFGSGPKLVMILSTRGAGELIQYLDNGTFGAQDVQKIEPTTKDIFLGPVTKNGSELKDGVALYTSKSAWKKASGTYTPTAQDAVLSDPVALSRG